LRQGGSPIGRKGKNKDHWGVGKNAPEQVGFATKKRILFQVLEKKKRKKLWWEGETHTKAKGWDYRCRGQEKKLTQRIRGGSGVGALVKKNLRYQKGNLVKRAIRAGGLDVWVDIEKTGEP